MHRFYTTRSLFHAACSLRNRISAVDMSTWTNELDVFRDLDRLSGLSNNNVSYPSLHAFGRGRIVIQKNAIGREIKVAQFSPPKLTHMGNIPQDTTETVADTNGHDSSTWDRDRDIDLFMQLRQVCGRGYSNELIEEEFGYKACSAQDPLKELPEISHQEDAVEEASAQVPVSNVEPKVIVLSEPASIQQKCLNPPSRTVCELPARDVVATRLFVHPPKLKARRNALLNSLARIKTQHEPDNQLVAAAATSGASTDKTPITEVVGIPTDKSQSPIIKISSSDLSYESPNRDTDSKLWTAEMEAKKADVKYRNVVEEIQVYSREQKQYTKNWADIRKHKAPYLSTSTVNVRDLLSNINATADTSQAPHEDSETKPEIDIQSLSDAETPTHCSQDISYVQKEQMILDLKPENRSGMHEPISDKLTTLNWADIRKNKAAYSNTGAVNAHDLHNSTNTVSVSSHSAILDTKIKSEMGFHHLSDAKSPTYCLQDKSYARREQTILELQPENRSGMDEPVSDELMTLNWANIRKNKATYSNTETVNVHDLQNSIKAASVSSQSPVPDTETSILKLQPENRNKVNEHMSAKLRNLNWADIRKHKAAYSNTGVVNTRVLQSKVTAASLSSQILDSVNETKREISFHNLSDAQPSTHCSQEKSVRQNQQFMSELKPENRYGMDDHLHDKLVTLNWADIRKHKAAYSNADSLNTRGLRNRANAAPGSSRTQDQGSEIKSEINTHNSAEQKPESRNGVHNHLTVLSDSLMNFYCEEQNSKITNDTRDCSFAVCGSADGFYEHSKTSWQSLKQHSPRPQKLLLCDYIDPCFSPAPTQSWPSAVEIFSPDSKSDELKIESVEEFPPL